MENDMHREVLRKLKKNSRVQYVGGDINLANGKIIKHGQYGYKIRMSRYKDFPNQMVVQFHQGQCAIVWYDLTCDIIKVADRINGIK